MPQGKRSFFGIANIIKFVASDVSTWEDVPINVSVALNQLSARMTTVELNSSTPLGTSSPVVNFINDISDVIISSVTDNEILSYDSASNKWMNQTASKLGLSIITHSHNISDLTDVTISTLVDANILVYDLANVVWKNKVLSGDATIANTGALTLAASGVTAGNYSPLVNITIDIKGRITSASVSILNLDGLNDVIITNVSTNEVLTFNGANWVNQASGGGSSDLSGLTDTSIVSLVDANILVYDLANVVWKNKVLSGDATIANTGALTLAASGVTAGNYSSPLTIAVDVKGRITSATSDSVLSLADGTVSAPSLTFSSDLNTGIYRVGVDELGIASGGNKSFSSSFDGTNKLSTAFGQNHDFGFQQGGFTTTGATFKVEGTTSSLWFSGDEIYSDNTTEFRIKSAGNLYFHVNSGGEFDPVIFCSKSTKTVGIGTTAPVTQLHLRFNSVAPGSAHEGGGLVIHDRNLSNISNQLCGVYLKRESSFSAAFLGQAAFLFENTDSASSGLLGKAHLSIRNVNDKLNSVDQTDAIITLDGSSTSQTRAGVFQISPLSGFDIQTSIGIKRVVPPGTPPIFYEVTDTDMLIAVSDTSGLVTINLPTAIGKEGRVLVIEDISGVAGNSFNIEISPFGVESINGSTANDVIDTNYGMMQLVSNGSDWNKLIDTTVLSAVNSGGKIWQHTTNLTTGVKTNEVDINGDAVYAVVYEDMTIGSFGADTSAQQTEALGSSPTGIIQIISVYGYAQSNSGPASFPIPYCADDGSGGIAAISLRIEVTGAVNLIHSNITGANDWTYYVVMKYTK